LPEEILNVKQLSEIYEPDSEELEPVEIMSALYAIEDSQPFEF